MLDLILGYLIIINLLFNVNTGLTLGNYKINNLKLVLISITIGILFFVVINIANTVSINLVGFLTYFFMILSIVLFIIYWKNIKAPITSTILYFISSFILASQLNGLSFINSTALTLISILTIIVSFQLSKLLHYAKREYNIIVGEYMSLMIILIFIFGLTYYSTLTLDYKMFSSFLILTPTYKLIYVIILIAIIFIIGLYWNDKKN